MNNQCSPSAPDIKQLIRRLKLQLATDMFKLRLLRLIQIGIWLFEVSAGIDHILVEPQCIKVIRYIVVKLDRRAILFLRMRGDRTQARSRQRRRGGPSFRQRLELKSSI